MMSYLPLHFKNESRLPNLNFYAFSPLDLRKGIVCNGNPQLTAPGIFLNTFRHHMYAYSLMIV